MRDYPTLVALRVGDTIEVEGIPVKMREGAILVGDLYVGEHNGPARLLTCQSYSDDKSWINPEENAYAYDWFECVRVEAVL
jgi:hypothetical protein